jgi:hypothetical protein
MTRTTVPPTHPENPTGEVPVRDPNRGTTKKTDKIAPPAPGVGQPVDAPVDPNRRPGQQPGDRPQPEDSGL